MFKKMGVYGNLYQLNFQRLKELISQMKKVNFTKQDFIGWYSIPLRENQQVLIKNAEYLDSNFQNIKPNLTKHKDLRKNQLMLSFYENYALFFENHVCKTCLIDSIGFYISKKRLTNIFKDTSVDFLYGNRHSLAFDILDKLDGPCFWTHNSGGYNEGIRSWISPYEVELLLLDIETLEIRYDDKIEKMNQFKDFLNSTARNKYGILNGGDLNF